VLLNAWVMSDDEEILVDDFDLPGVASSEAAEAGPAASPPLHALPQKRPTKGTTYEHRRTERERILDALRACNWNRVKAAELSGIPRRTFYRRLREYGIQ
jgi:transcriptional regulator of acetoin/glycerol metabolism